jgi:hypothetical protein
VTEVEADASRRFTAIYDVHHGQVYAYAVSRAGRQLADDIVGDTFLVGSVTPSATSASASSTQARSSAARLA